ncbi:MAG TPA: 3-deoxy-7-phosphoheptulonate synthase, partial [Candidatus Competibacter phosphatis]|nr:3-deoxy-7-phosphoheptulonate synthase [Candidatus Competibacter phosphatis]
MPMPNLYNINVAALEVLPTPEEIKQRLPLSETAANAVFQARETIKRILDRQDPRLFAVVGPCSIHDVVAARDYAQRLKALADEVQDTLFLVMRVYFEKPRTTVGWKGLINDPRMDDTFRIDEGLQVARDLLLELAELGLPAGTEALDPIIPQYIHDLIAWTAIGARTTESQTHREIASGLSTPVGFKNGTNGSLEVAINALQSVASPHSFLGINQFGQSAVIRTLGNRYGHMVLRGGDRPNYDSVSIALCEKALRDKKLPVNIVVDCSHANSFKDPAMQPLVMRDCVHQIMEGNRSIAGVMIESNLGAGNQSIPADRSQLKYGVSVTDACVDWATTETMLREAHAKLKGVLPAR